MQRFDKYNVQTLGFALIVIGILLLVVGLIGGPIRLHFLTSEPLPWYWWVPAASFFSGIALVIIGTILLIVARSMKPEHALEGRSKYQGRNYDPKALRRPSSITTLLLATVTSSSAFTAVFLLGGIPEGIATYLAFAFAIVPLSLFLPIFAYASFRHIVRTERQRLEKQIPAGCVICGEPLPNTTLRDVGKLQGPHYETVHPDFWRWVRKPRRRMMLAVLFIGLIIWLVADYELVINNYLLFIAGGALSAVLALAWSLLEKRNLKSFRSQWRRTYKS